MQAELETILVKHHAESGTIHLLEDGVLLLKAHAGVPPPLVEIVSRVPIGKGMAGLAAERNEPVTSCNIQRDETGNVKPGARDSGVLGAIAVPIRDCSGSVVGALGIGLREQHDYTEDEIAALLAEAAMLAPRAVG